MAIRSKEEIIKSLTALIGENDSDEALTMVEDVSDTIDSLNENNGEDWKNRYDELDKSWRKRYKERFLSGPDKKEEEEKDAEEKKTYKFEDLFEEEK